MWFNDKRLDNNKILICLNVKFFLCIIVIGEIVNNCNFLSMNFCCKVMIFFLNIYSKLILKNFLENLIKIFLFVKYI